MSRPDFTAFLVLLFACCGSGREQAGKAPAESMCIDGGVAPDTISASCRLEAGNEGLLFGSGRILEVHVVEGDSVLAGQVLVTLSTDAVAEGAVTAGVREIEAARVAVENARLGYQRASSLFQAGAISELELDGALTAMQAAEAEYAAARAGLSSAVSGRSASVVQAPFDGVVGKVWAGEGSMAGNDPLLMITGGSGFVARVLLPEYFIGSVEPGAEAWFETIAVPGERFDGFVTSVSPGIDPVSRLLPVTVSIEDHGDLLVPGLYGTVSILSGRR